MYVFNTNNIILLYLQQNLETEGAYDEPIHKCEMLALFELGSCHHDYYLVNLRLPVLEDGSLNADIPSIKDIWIYVSMQIMSRNFSKLFMQARIE
jgi:hypothetical protein